MEGKRVWTKRYCRRVSSYCSNQWATCQWSGKTSLTWACPFNNVGDASNGNVVFPSALHRDKLTISVSTDGASPKLTKSIMAELEALYPPSYSSYIDFYILADRK